MAGDLALMARGSIDATFTSPEQISTMLSSLARPTAGPSPYVTARHFLDKVEEWECQVEEARRLVVADRARVQSCREQTRRDSESSLAEVAYQRDKVRAFAGIVPVFSGGSAATLLLRGGP
jgi:hypothetical protein